MKRSVLIFFICITSSLEIFTDGDSIIMRKYHAQGSCVFCGDISPDAVLLHGKYVCPVCRKALGK